MEAFIVEIRNGEEEKIFLHLNLSGRLDIWKAIISSYCQTGHFSLATVTAKGLFSVLKKIQTDLRSNLENATIKLQAELQH